LSCVKKVKSKIYLPLGEEKLPPYLGRVGVGSDLYKVNTHPSLPYPGKGKLWDIPGVSAGDVPCVI